MIKPHAFSSKYTHTQKCRKNKTISRRQTFLPFRTRNEKDRLKMATAPGASVLHMNTHRALQLSTKWFSHHTTLEELVGGMLTLHTIPLYVGNIAYGEVSL